MATSTIKQYPQMQQSAVIINVSYITPADNHIETEKWGRVCMISGYFKNTDQIPAYSTVFTLPSDRVPIIAFSLQTSNDNVHYWLFADTTGAVSTQSTLIPAGTYYITAFYMTTY